MDRIAVSEDLEFVVSKSSSLMQGMVFPQGSAVFDYDGFCDSIVTMLSEIKYKTGGVEASYDIEECNDGVHDSNFVLVFRNGSEKFVEIYFDAVLAKGKDNDFSITDAIVAEIGNGFDF